MLAVMIGDSRRHIPNAITVARLVVAAGFFATLNVYRFPDRHAAWAVVAVILFILAAASDALDGYLARRWNATSTFGRIMDPFVDKVLIIGAFVYLAGPRFIVPARVDEDFFLTMASGIYPWMVVVIIARELLVTSIRGVAESMGVEFGAKFAGKLKMIVQSVTVPLIILTVVFASPYETAGSIWICHILAYTTMIVTLCSGVPYLYGLGEILRARTRPAPTDKRDGS
jgi:CDP-diacylglycerol--glycerol-3-phosphate 3-phosphatidyltransferase